MKKRQENSDFKTLLGTIIRERREALGLTQAALAGRCGTTRVAINNIERGRHRPRVSLCAALANVLQAPVAELLVLSGHLDPDLMDRAVIYPTERIAPDHWQSRLVGDYIRSRRTESGSGPDTCARIAAEWLGIIDPGTASDDWSRVEAGYLPARWAESGKEVPLSQAPTRYVWAAARAVRADLDVALYLAGKWRSSIARRVKFDLGPFYAAAKAAKLPQPPWLDLPAFQNVLDELRGAAPASAEGGPLIQQLQDGQWRIEVVLPATLTGADIGRLAEMLSEMSRRSPGPGN